MTWRRRRGRGGVDLCAHLEDADPVLGVRRDVGRQRVAALQRRLRQEALAHILEEDVRKVGRLHDADAAAGRRVHHLE